MAVFISCKVQKIVAECNIDAVSTESRLFICTSIDTASYHLYVSLLSRPISCVYLFLEEWIISICTRCTSN